MAENTSTFSPSVQIDRTLTRQRLHWVDYAKGIGIFLVVVGHVQRGLVNSSILQPSFLLTFVDGWIYAFHMPLFFFISGLFVQRSLSTKPWKNFVLDKLCTIAYPYFLWSLLQSILQVLGSRYTNDKLSIADIWKIAYQPLLQFWFLYTLFVILLLYGILHKLKLSPQKFLIFSILLYCLHGLNVSFGSWGVLYLVRRHAIYFALGVIFGGSGAFLSIVRSKLSTLILIINGGYLAVGLTVKLGLTENAIAIPLIAILGTAASLSLAILLEKFNLLPSVQKWGLFSLEIFVGHTIAASIFRILLQKVFGFSDPLIYFILGTAIAIYAPIALSMICSKLGFKYMFTLRFLT